MTNVIRQSHPRPLGPRVVAAVIGMPVLYVLSLGPVISVLRQMPRSDWSNVAIGYYERPLYWGLVALAKSSPKVSSTVSVWITEYLELWGAIG